MSGSGGGSSSPRGGGSGGGPGGFGGPGGGPSSVDCAQLSFVTTLGSPDPAVVASIRMGDICDVVLVPHPTSRIVVMTRPSGVVLGAITSNWEDLLGCLGKGVQFVAEILSTGSPVRVLVRAL